MFHPNGNIAMVATAFVLQATIIGVRRHRVISPPKSELQPRSISYMMGSYFCCHHNHEQW